MLHVCNSTTLCLGPATSIADEIATIFPRHDRSIHDVGRWRRPNTGGVVLHENATSDCADEDADATRSAQRPSHTLLREERDRADIRAGRGTKSDAIHETGVHAVRQGERCKRSFFYYGQIARGIRTGILLRLSSTFWALFLLNPHKGARVVERCSATFAVRGGHHGR